MPKANQFVSHLNGQVHYVEAGKGPCVVFLHGFLENKTIWNSFQRKLKHRYRVICIDLPGHGLTDNFGYLHTMENMAEAVYSVLRFLKIRKCFLIGHSMGGYTALAFGELYPDMVKGICLFHSTASADSEQRKKDRDRTIQLVKKSYRLFIGEAVPNLFYTEKYSRKKGIEQILKMAESTSIQGVVAALEGMKIRSDREVMLQFSPFSVHYIIGKHDAILDAEVLLAQRKNGRDSQHLLLNNTGHMGFLEEPTKSLSFIEKLLKLK